MTSNINPIQWDDLGRFYNWLKEESREKVYCAAILASAPPFDSNSDLDEHVQSRVINASCTEFQKMLAPTTEKQNTRKIQEWMASLIQEDQDQLAHKIQQVYEGWKKDATRALETFLDAISRKKQIIRIPNIYRFLPNTPLEKCTNLQTLDVSESLIVELPDIVQNRPLILKINHHLIPWIQKHSSSLHPKTTLQISSPPERLWIPCFDRTNSGHEQEATYQSNTQQALFFRQILKTSETAKKFVRKTAGLSKEAFIAQLAECTDITALDCTDLEISSSDLSKLILKMTSLKRMTHIKIESDDNKPHINHLNIFDLLFQIKSLEFVTVFVSIDYLNSKLAGEWSLFHNYSKQHGLQTGNLFKLDPITQEGLYYILTYTKNTEQGTQWPNSPAPTPAPAQVIPPQNTLPAQPRPEASNLTPLNQGESPPPNKPEPWFMSVLSPFISLFNAFTNTLSSLFTYLHSYFPE